MEGKFHHIENFFQPAGSSSCSTSKSSSEISKNAEQSEVIFVSSESDTKSSSYSDDSNSEMY